MRLVDIDVPEKGELTAREKRAAKLKLKRHRRELRRVNALQVAMTTGFPRGYKNRAARRAQYSTRGEYKRRVHPGDRFHYTKGPRPYTLYDRLTDAGIIK